MRPMCMLTLRRFWLVFLPKVYSMARVGLAASSRSRNRWIRVVLPTPLLPSDTIFCENLRMRVSFGRRFPLQEPVDQGGLNKALAIFKTLRYEGGRWLDLLPRNRWIRVVLPTPLLPAEHCVNTWIWGWALAGSFLQEDQGSLTHTLATCINIIFFNTYVWEWALVVSFRCRNLWIRVVLSTPLLPSEYNILWKLKNEGKLWPSFPAPGTGGSGWS